MDLPQIIILYGKYKPDSFHEKQQKMIDNKTTCGYREYASKYGHIIYLTRQNVHKNWEHSITNINKVIEFCNKRPDYLVWSVKHDESGDKDLILRKIKNLKVYYSCCSLNMYNSYCNISLVDDNKRIKNNAVLHIKGKDENYWKPIKSYKDKQYDYLLMGHRADKNELYFLEKINSIKEKRNILWIGGEKHKKKISSHHNINFTNFIGPEEIRHLIPKAKVGILFTEHPSEGFPQSFLEMTMCGVPVIYSDTGPINKNYVHKNNCLICKKKELIICSENLLKKMSESISHLCRQEAIENYSLDISYYNMYKNALNFRLGVNK